VPIQESSDRTKHSSGSTRPTDLTSIAGSLAEGEDMWRRGQRIFFQALLAGSSFFPSVARAEYFYTVTPCRVYDTRYLSPPTPLGGLSVGVQIRNTCGIPSEASAVAGNLTAVSIPGYSGGYIAIYPPESTSPPLDPGTLSFNANKIRANNFVMNLGAN